MGPLSTEEVAREVGIGRSTLELWIREGKLNPKVLQIGRKNYRVWTDREIEKVIAVKEKTYRKRRTKNKKKA